MIGTGRREPKDQVDSYIGNWVAGPNSRDIGLVQLGHFRAWEVAISDKAKRREGTVARGRIEVIRENWVEPMWQCAVSRYRVSSGDFEQELQAMQWWLEQEAEDASDDFRAWQEEAL